MCRRGERGHGKLENVRVGGDVLFLDLQSGSLSGELVLSSIGCRGGTNLQKGGGSQRAVVYRTCFGAVKLPQTLSVLDEADEVMADLPFLHSGLPFARHAVMEVVHLLMLVQQLATAEWRLLLQLLDQSMQRRTFVYHSKLSEVTETPPGERNSPKWSVWRLLAKEWIIAIVPHAFPNSGICER